VLKYSYPLTVLMLRTTAFVRVKGLGYWTAAAMDLIEGSLHLEVYNHDQEISMSNISLVVADHFSCRLSMRALRLSVCLWLFK
jgi:hypothetical protein